MVLLMVVFVMYDVHDGLLKQGWVMVAVFHAPVHIGFGATL